MSNAKKVLGVVIALAMILNIFAVSAFAAATIDDAGNTQAWSLGTPVKVDDTHYTVDVSLTTNYKVGPIEFQITNSDNTNVVLQGTSVTGAAIPAAYNADISVNNATGKVTIVPSTAGQTSVETVQMNGVIATLHFILSSATAGATIALVNAPKSSTSIDGTLIAARMSNDDLIGGSAIVGQEVTSVGTSVSIGAVAATPELALTAAGTTAGVVIDTAKTFGGAYTGAIYGFPLPGNGATKIAAGTYYDTYIQATNGGTLTYVKTPYVTRPASYGTGTTVQLKDAGGTVLATYIIIIFGDVDGSGQINVTDITKAVSEYDSPATLSLPQIMSINILVPARGTAAAKAEALYTVTITDITSIVAAVDTPAEIQKALAVAHLTYSATNYQ